MTSAIQGAARDATHHPALETGARLGYAASGVVHLLLGWLAVQLAWGSGQDADQASALEQLGGNPVGAVLLWLVTLGLALLGVWQVAAAVVADEAKDRLTAAAKAVALGVLGVLFVLAAVQHDAEQAGGLDSALKALLELPAGPVVLTAVGVGIAAFGIYCFGRARHAKV